ncbi:MAG: hypothetical protein OXS33_12655, partial [bacterium]|nr:hypothetical protein [bacterium]
MRDKEKKLRGELPHLLSKVIVPSWQEGQPDDVRRPTHQPPEDFVFLPTVGRVKWLREAKHRVVECIGHHSPDAPSRPGAIEAEGTRPAEELRRIAHMLAITESPHSRSLKFPTS